MTTVSDFKLLNHHWEHLGFFQWLESIQKEYTWRRDVFAEACDRYLPKVFVDWTPTRAGMFVSTFVHFDLVDPC